MTQIKTATELEEILFNRIRKMSIEQKMQVLEFFDTSILKTTESTPAMVMEDAEPGLSPLERRQRLVEIVSSLDDRGGVMPGVDLVAWQREQRQDRPLPGRED